MLSVVLWKSREELVLASVVSDLHCLLGVSLFTIYCQISMVYRGNVSLLHHGVYWWPELHQVIWHLGTLFILVLFLVTSWALWTANESTISKPSAEDSVNIEMFSKTIKMFWNCFSSAKIVSFLQTFWVFSEAQQSTGSQRWMQICVGVQKGKYEAFLS